MMLTSALVGSSAWGDFSLGPRYIALIKQGYIQLGGSSWAEEIRRHEDGFVAYRSGVQETCD